MNLLDKVKNWANGTANLSLWLGSGGHCVSQEVAEERASKCMTCSENKPGDPLEAIVADKVREFLEFKNQLDLRVPEEERLLSCAGCGCQLKLLIWETQDRIVQQTDAAERAKAPAFCWKLRKP